MFELLSFVGLWYLSRLIESKKKKKKLYSFIDGSIGWVYPIKEKWMRL